MHFSFTSSIYAFKHSHLVEPGVEGQKLPHIVVHLLGGDDIKVISVYFAYGQRMNLLEIVGVGGSLDRESTPYVQIKKSYNPK